MSAAVYVADCRFGRGVFAARAIRRDEEILRFSGPLIDLAAALAKCERQCDPLQVGPESYLDIGEPAVLVNHSCEPNAGIRDDCVLVAIADIRPGEEISYDYSTTMSEQCWTLACACGTPSCRGTVGDFETMPLPAQRKYLHLGIVQRYIARRMTSGPGGPEGSTAKADGLKAFGVLEPEPRLG